MIKYTDSKYHNRKVDFAGKKFDSKKEARRYQELVLLERAGKIWDLVCQQKYTLIPAQYIDGKCAERAITYYADFAYKDMLGEYVEDTKGMKTPEYIIKRKLMLWVKNIRIIEL